MRICRMTQGTQTRLYNITEGWDGEGCGRGVQDGEHVYTHGRSMSMYDKTTTIVL